MSEELRANLEQVIDKWGLTGDKSQIRPKKSKVIPLREPTAPAPVMPATVNARPVKTTSRVEPSGYSRSSGLWQWLLRGLQQDRLSAVIVLIAMLSFILSLCAAFVYVLSTML